MILRFAVASDFASITQDGKLNVLGVLDRIFAPQFPAVHRTLFLVLSLETEREDEGQMREIHVQLIDSDAQVLSEIRCEMHFGEGKQVFNQIHLFHDILFNAPGAYGINVFFDGQIVKTLEIELVLLPPQPQM
jgi:hypothetical protein